MGTGLFDELAARGGMFSNIDQDLARTFRTNFEDGMAQFRLRHDVLTAPFLLRMAEYFAQFQPGAANLYIQLIDGLVGLRRQFTCATLNYDLLIELSAALLGFDVSYVASVIPRYNVSVLKVHGSCNFLPDVEPSRLVNVGFRFSGPDSYAINAPIRIGDRQQVLEFCAREGSVAPALALFARGKSTLFCPKIVQQQRQEFEEAARRARRIYVIGVRVNEEDGHVWSPLGHAAGSMFYVGPEPSASEFLRWAGRHGRSHATVLAPSFELAVPEILGHHRHP